MIKVQRTEGDKMYVSKQEYERLLSRIRMAIAGGVAGPLKTVTAMSVLEALDIHDVTELARFEITYNLDKVRRTVAERTLADAMAAVERMADGLQLELNGWRETTPGRMWYTRAEEEGALLMSVTIQRVG